MTPAALSDTDVVFALAGEDQTTAVLALLPELATAQLWPDRVWLAHLKGDRARVVGAAAFEPVVQDRAVSGFRALVQVLGGFRRRGIGRGLVRHLCADARLWHVPCLHTWGHLPEGAGAAFVQACGGVPGMTMHHFIGETRHSLPVTGRLVAALRSRGRVPEAFQVLSLKELPTDAAAALYVSQFGGTLSAASAMIRRQLENPLAASLSFGLWDGQVLAGFLLAGVAADMPEVRYWLTDPTLRHGWAAAVLLDIFLRRMDELGIPKGRYSCTESTTATLNFARNSAAQSDGVSRSYQIDLLESVSFA